MNRQRSRLSGLLLLLLAGSASGYPGWGLQVDLAGNVYFSGAEHVYRAAAGGGVDQWVPDVHSHALYLDDQERLVGDHSWVDPSGAFHRSFWRADGAGTKETIPELEAARSFGMPAPGGGWLMPGALDGSDASVLLKIDESGRSVVSGGDIGSVDGSLEEARFGIFGAVISDGRNGLLLTSGGQLRAVSAKGVVSTLIGSDQGHGLEPDGPSRLLGLSLAFNGDVFVADTDARALLRFNRNTGAVSTVLKADFVWTIAGVYNAGTYIYLLEFSRLPWSDDVRIRRMDSNGQIEFVARNP